MSTELALVFKFSFEDPSQYSAESVLGKDLAAKVIRPQVRPKGWRTYGLPAQLTERAPLPLSVSREQMPQPRTVLTAWILSATMFGVWCALFFLVVVAASRPESNPSPNPANNKAASKPPRSRPLSCYACTRTLSRILLWGSSVPLMYLVAVDVKDTLHF